MEIIENLKEARDRIKMVVNFGSFARTQDKEVLFVIYLKKSYIKHRFAKNSTKTSNTNLSPTKKSTII
jgi:phage-related protein